MGYNCNSTKTTSSPLSNQNQLTMEQVKFYKSAEAPADEVSLSWFQFYTALEEDGEGYTVYGHWDTSFRNAEKELTIGGNEYKKLWVDRTYFERAKQQYIYYKVTL